VSPDLILQLLTGVISLVSILVGRKAHQYFQVGNRTARANLVAVLAKDVLSLVVLQKGVSTDKAEILRVAIDMLKGVLIGQGFKADTAGDIAKSAISGAAAEQGFDLAAISL
jgi:hypothetical protein